MGPKGSHKYVITGVFFYQGMASEEMLQFLLLLVTQENDSGLDVFLNLLKPNGHAMHQQFNIQEPYVLPTLYLCVLYLSENKQRLVPLTA